MSDPSRGNEMLQNETDLKTRRYFGGDIPETPVGKLIVKVHYQV